MAIDNATYLKDMDINLPANTDPRSEGAGQIRAVKNVLKNTFPNLDGAVNAAPAEFNKMLDGTQGRFVGEVTMFSGLIADIPDAWFLCDGTVQNGFQTPDLRGKFVLGYDANDSVDNPMRHAGGDNDGHGVIQIPSHTHNRGSMNITGSLIVSQSLGQTPDPVEGAFDRETATLRGTPDDADVQTLQGKANFDASRTWAGEVSVPKYSSATGVIDNGDGTATIGEAKGNMPEYVVLAFICYVGKATS